MHAITHIEPPIAFRRRNGRTAVLRDTDALADWLDRFTMRSSIHNAPKVE